MFYFFSKLLAFLIRPSVWVMLLLLLAIWKYQRNGRKYLVAAFSIFMILGNNALLQLTLRWWEPLPVELTKSYSQAVVLGGYLSENTLRENALPEFGERAERLTHALALYQEGKVKNLIFSGGSGGILHEQIAEATVVKSFVQQLGYPISDFIFEDEAINTHENATKSVAFIDKDEPVVLITSAWHMYRSIACFNKEGIEVIPYPVDYMQSLSPLYPTDYFLPKPAVLWHWEILIKEWVGLLIYKMKGYI